MKNLIILGTLLLSVSAQAKPVNEMSQQELKTALEGHSRCTLVPMNEAAQDSEREVTMIQAKSDNGSAIYFAEIEEDNESTIHYLPKTALTLIGYKSIGKRAYKVGQKVSASMNMFNDSVVDSTIEISNNIFEDEARYFESCRF